MKLKYVYIHPPIPYRGCDFKVYDEETYDPEDIHCIVGWGATMEAAHADFMSQWLDRQEERAA